MSEWFSCGDKLPQLGDDVLVWNGSTVTIARLMGDECGQYWESDDDVAELIPPTHWHAIPEPPLG
jgi:hypothetical protein